MSGPAEAPVPRTEGPRRAARRCPASWAPPSSTTTSCSTGRPPLWCSPAVLPWPAAGGRAGRVAGTLAAGTWPGWPARRGSASGATGRPPVHHRDHHDDHGRVQRPDRPVAHQCQIGPAAAVLLVLLRLVAGRRGGWRVRRRHADGRRALRPRPPGPDQQRGRDRPAGRRGTRHQHHAADHPAARAGVAQLGLADPLRGQLRAARGRPVVRMRLDESPAYLQATPTDGAPLVRVLRERRGDLLRGTAVESVRSPGSGSTACTRCPTPRRSATATPRRWWPCWSAPRRASC